MKQKKKQTDSFRKFDPSNSVGCIKENLKKQENTRNSIQRVGRNPA